MLAATLTLLVLTALPSPTRAPEEQELLGTVGTADVRMELDLSNPKPSATYAYASGTTLLFLEGDALGKDGALTLRSTEYGGADKPEWFDGKLDRAKRTYQGTWHQGARSLPFSLRVVAHTVPLGGKGVCSQVRVLEFDLDDAALAHALDAAARALAGKLVHDDCDPTDASTGWSANQQLWAMTDGLVSVRSFSGDGTSKGSGSTSVVWDTRARPIRALQLSDGAVDAKRLARTLGEEAYAFLKKRGALEDAQVDPKEKTAPNAGEWAVTPSGIQLFFAMSSWTASGDGTVYALVRREALAPLYRPDSALGAWARAKYAP